ncbi:peroxidase-related enzyme [Saccharopolyspora hirsuta]|nr:peroxidase-related enzyme [Saccharopolyspora hirsuta]
MTTASSVRADAVLSVLRPDVRELTANVDAAVLRPAESALDRADRARIALRVALVNDQPDDELAAELDALVGDGAADVVRDTDRWDELSEAQQALLAHCELVALDPADVTVAEIGELRAQGFSTAQIVAAAQVVAATSFRIRLLRGLQLVAEPDTTPDAEPANTIAVGATADGCELPTPDEAFPQMRWVPWVEADSFDEALQHDPEALEACSALYNAIMTDPGELATAERELAALAASLRTGCELSSGVHGRRQVELSDDRVTSVALAEAGPAAVPDQRQRAIVDAAAALAPTPTALTSAHIGRLRAAGVSAEGIRDLIAVAAMTAWTNRLAMTLGNATTRDTDW